MLQSLRQQSIPGGWTAHTQTWAVSSAPEENDCGRQKGGQYSYFHMYLLPGMPSSLAFLACKHTKRLSGQCLLCPTEGGILNAVTPTFTHVRKKRC